MKLSQIRSIKDPTVRYHACKDQAHTIRAELAELTAIRQGAVADLYETGLTWAQVAQRVGLASGGYAANLAAGRGISNVPSVTTVAKVNGRVSKKATYERSPKRR